MTANDSTRSLPVVVLTITLLLLLGGAGAFAWSTWGGPGEESDPKPELPPEVQEPATTTPDDTPAPAAGTVDVQTPEQAGIAVEDCIAYPDGTRLPPLNGVLKAPRIAFHRQIPFTKIIGRYTDRGGVEWYVHENGARSTTTYKVQNGKLEAVGELQMPVSTTVIVDK